MAQCPVCASSVSDDFGLIECGECGAQLIVHMDGRVEHSGADVPIQSDPENSQSLPAQDLSPEGETPEFIEPFREFEPEPEPELENTVHASSETPDLAPLENSEIASVESAEFQPEDSPASAPEEVDLMASLDSPLDEPSSEPYVSPQAAALDSPDLADVTKFANSANSGSRDGSLRYTLLVEGIDTADVRLAFKEALTDRKLLFDTDKILKSIRQGKVAIENVSSAKAHVVVARLKHLPLFVKWEQHGIHES